MSMPVKSFNQLLMPAQPDMSHSGPERHVRMVSWTEEKLIGQQVGMLSTFKQLCSSMHMDRSLGSVIGRAGIGKEALEKDSKEFCEGKEDAPATAVAVQASSSMIVYPTEAEEEYIRELNKTLTENFVWQPKPQGTVTPGEATILQQEEVAIRVLPITFRVSEPDSGWNAQVVSELSEYADVSEADARIALRLAQVIILNQSGEEPSRERTEEIIRQNIQANALDFDPESLMRGISEKVGEIVEVNAKPLKELPKIEFKK